MMGAIMVLALTNPWQVGPAPSAHPTQKSWNVGADLGGTVAGPWPLWGTRIAAGFTPHERLWTALELGYGQGWRLCIDCNALATTWTARGLVFSHHHINIAPWSVLTSVNGTFEWTPGLAIEAGTQRLRFDTSWPLWSTWDVLTLLRSTPELGVAWSWGPRQSTRVAVVGLEPAVAVTHRVWLHRWAFEATARGGEEGVGLTVGFRFWSPIAWHRGWS